MLAKHVDHPIALLEHVKRVENLCSDTRAHETSYQPGPQEEGRRAGTENLPGILSMLAALRTCVDELGKSGSIEMRYRIKDEFESALQRSVPGARILGATVQRIWNTSAVIMPAARDCRQRWVVKLDRLGFAVSTGSACSSGKEEPSHVLRAMGFSAADAGRVLRFSAGWETTASDWDGLLQALSTISAYISKAGQKTLATTTNVR